MKREEVRARGTRWRNGGPCRCSPLCRAWRSCPGSLPGVCRWLRHRTSRLFRWFGARPHEILPRLVILKHSKENLEPKVIYQIWLVVCFSSVLYRQAAYDILVLLLLRCVLGIQMSSFRFKKQNSFPMSSHWVLLSNTPSEVCAQSPPPPRVYPPFCSPAVNGGHAVLHRDGGGRSSGEEPRVWTTGVLFSHCRIGLGGVWTGQQVGVCRWLLVQQGLWKLSRLPCVCARARGRGRRSVGPVSMRVAWLVDAVRESGSMGRT